MTGGVSDFLKLVVTAAALLALGMAGIAIFGVDLFDYLRLSILVLAAVVLLLRWLRREERPYDELDEAEDSVGTEPSQRTTS
jgi:hypothetical protein